MANSVKKIVIVANTSWFVANFHGTLVKTLVSKGYIVVVAAPLDELSDRFTELGAVYHVIPMSRGALLSFADLKFFAAMFQIYRRERPDIVLHMTIKPVLYGTFAAALSSIPKIVNMVTGLGYVFIGNSITHRIIRPIVKLMYRLAVRFSESMLFLNNDDFRYFHQHHLVNKERSVVTNGSGVDSTQFPFTPPTNRTGECIILYVGRILKDKGVYEFVESARMVRKRYPAVRFQLLGKVDRENPSFITEVEIESWVCAHDVEYLGSVDDVRPVIAQADIVVLPSYREGVPRSIQEAMAMGKAIVATDVPGCRDVVANGINGILVESKNVPQLADAIESLILSPETRAMMGRNGRDMILKKYDSKIIDTVIISALERSTPSKFSKTI